MNKKVILKVMKKRALRAISKPHFKTKVKLIVGTIALAGVLIGVVVYSAGAEEREEIKALAKARAQEIQLVKDKKQAEIEAEEMAQKMSLFNAEQTLEEISKEGEFTALKVDFETIAEKESDHKSSIGKWWGKNILKINIPYTIRYMVDMSDIHMFIDNNHTVNISIDERDLYLSIEQGQYTEMTPDDSELGIVPEQFSSSEILSLVNAKRKEMINVYSSNEDKISEAMENIKSQITSLAKTFETDVKFIENTSFQSITNIIETTEDNK